MNIPVNISIFIIIFLADIVFGGFHRCKPDPYFHLCRRFLDPRLIPRYFFFPEDIPRSGASTMVEYYKKKMERIQRKMNQKTPPGSISPPKYSEATIPKSNEETSASYQGRVVGISSPKKKNRTLEAKKVVGSQYVPPSVGLQLFEFVQ
ncbi:hypothetical protein ANCCAN_10080 [Ancylostoma caninum]|uniref:Uncharacterized protein n=1 Tax=Ancylostoma caninum TaxID=29170 RepID=A0A368GLX2_ANCCA|nr:hypothetical protein ANCCAN_10080 [Ancylostoma caninum]